MSDVEFGRPRVTQGEGGHVMALGGATAGGIARIRELPLRGMITVRCDLADPALDAATGITGCAMPGTLGIELNGDRALGWLSPDELLVIVPHAEAGAAVAKLDEALVGTHALVAEVSDSRSVFSVEGPGARDVIAKLAPVPMRTFAPGTLRRTRLAQAPAAFWMTGEDTIELFCFRSHAPYVFGILANAAHGPRVTI